MGKDEIRERNKKLRNLLSEEEREFFEQKIESFLFDFLSDKQFIDFFVYLSFKSEVSTNNIIKRLKDAGKNVFVPKVNGETMSAVKLDGDLKENGFGIKEPKEEIFAKKIDVAITPLLAVDKYGNRLGFGKGFYDRFFKENECLKIGVCFAFQIEEEITAESHDIPLDIIISENGIIKTKG